MDSRVTTSVLALEYGATDPLTVQDEFWDSYQDYQQYASYLPALAVLALVLDIAGILLLVFLLRAAGWRKEAEPPEVQLVRPHPAGSAGLRAFGPSLSFSTRGTRSPSASTYPNWPPTCWSACVSSP